MRVMLAHDYTAQRGGAERVALALLTVFPGAPLLTSVYNAEHTFPGFADHDVRTTWLQNVPAFRKNPRLAFPFLGRVWGSTHVTTAEADVVIASSSGWAHGVDTAPGVAKIIYCHNPARWLYQRTEYFGGGGPVTLPLGPMLAASARRDKRWARSADRYLANSSTVARRIAATYGIDAEVVPPPIWVDVHGHREPVAGLEPGYFLTVARGRGYKNTSLLESAATDIPGARLVVVGSGSHAAPADTPAGVLRLGIVSDAELRWLYANARALVSASFEDFGLTPLEANAFGTPAVVLRAGGFLDTLEPGVSGSFIEQVSLAAVKNALLTLPDLDPAPIVAHARKFSLERFSERMHAVAREVIPSSSGGAASRSRRGE